MDAPSDVSDIAERLQSLSPQEKLVLRLRFALDGSYNHTLREVADGLHISSEGVREIERAALLKLKGTAV
jgi:RNA polymerase primary sigma factor